MTARAQGDGTGAAASRVLATVAAALRAAGPLPALSVGYSGGTDSSVLLVAAWRLAPSLDLPPPRALHVDHGLEPESAAWREHCRRECARRGIRFEALVVDARPAPGESPESAARDARYEALAARLSTGEALCVAHHADDQAETMLLRLLRGSGPEGLGAMAPERPLPPGRLLRPLLALRRDDIAACAAAWGLATIRDPANTRRRHPRVRLRREVLPLLQDLEPGAVDALARAACLQREAFASLDDLARLDLEACRGGVPGTLSRRALAGLPGRRRRSVLRLWLRLQGLPVPGRARLLEADRQVRSAAPDRHPRVGWPGGEVRVQGDDVFAFRGPPPAPGSGAWCWQPPAALTLPTGRLWAEPVTGSGLRACSPLTVCFRRGGERCRPAGRSRSQTLKRLLQERRVPAWARPGLPLLYRDGALAGVADLWVCAGHEAAAGEPGWRVRWAPNL